MQMILVLYFSLLFPRNLNKFSQKKQDKFSAKSKISFFYSKSYVNKSWRLLMTNRP